MSTRDRRTFTPSPAKREAIMALIGLYGLSGGGKTRSGVILARGMVGPKGRIAVLDTENKRARIFADKIPGGYDTIDLEPPFTPDLYDDALNFCIGKYDIVVVDSMSHEWEGEGGVLEMQEAELDRMAGDNYGKREACKMAAWIKPKMAHKKMMHTILRLPFPLIVCLRGQQKTRMFKDEDKKTKVQTDDFSTPIADPRFIFEMLINLEVYSDQDGAGGFCKIRKITNEDIYPCLPKGNEQINYSHGEKLMAWCRGSGTAAGASSQKPVDDKSKLLVELRDATGKIHGWKREHGSAEWPQAKAKLQTWIADELGIDTVIDAQDSEQLRQTLDAARKKLA